MRRALAGAAVVLALPAVAFAHAAVKSRSPHKNATVHHAVKQVNVTFVDHVTTGLIEIRKNGQVVPLKSTGLKTSDHAVVLGTPKAPLGNGRYTVHWRARSQDGHSEKGSWSFRVRR
jgi:copper resistance protein C